ncbi:MAG: 16S rRNA (uracil(1498)-N(3))-methyltransferase [Bacteroidetes bacterium]|nr:16S rRNA (uracil(1498)-N(3))-methyltransferase [Bacteroidota bacterium]MBU2585031.1 16S rRNA (uracil(1498)-N(3))-methyltransferase [Bacteroidota bacterium]
MNRFYFPTLNYSDSEIIVEGDEAHHIISVMRKSTGEMIEVSDGEGQIIECEIISIKKKQVFCRVLNRFHLDKEKPQFKFLVPVLKNPNRFEFMLEKLTELGVHEIIPFVSENSMRVSDKNSRWKKVLISAMKQSHVDFLPNLHLLSNFNEIITQINLSNSLIFHGDVEGEHPGELRLQKKISETESIYLAIGPEGDFSEEEKKILRSINSIPVKLSNNRLRSETAAIALMTLIKNLKPEASQ